MDKEEFAEPLGTPLPYSRHEPWTLAPWLTGIIVALVIFVILILTSVNRIHVFLEIPNIVKTESMSLLVIVDIELVDAAN